MRVSTITHSALSLGAALAAPALEASTNTQGFKLPENAVDGFYVAYFDEADNEIHERVRGPATTSELAQYQATTLEDAPANPPLEKRQKSWESWCGCGLTMHHGDCDAAVEDLKFQSDRCFETGCNHIIRPGQAWYSIRGSVVAFACNLNWLSVSVGRRDRITNFLQGVTDKCGWYVPGTAVHNEGITAYYGYMNYSPGLDFCTSSVSSPKKSCPK